MNRAAPSQARAGMLPPDPALPQLALALDGQHMAEVFGAAFGAQRGLRVRACSIDRIKYRPRRNCSVSYIVALHDEWRDQGFEQRIAARFCAAPEAAKRHAQASGRATLASLAGPALLHVPALGMLAHCAPNDAKLGALAILYDDARLRTDWLPEVVAALTFGQGRLLGHATTLVQYVPEDRVCARIELHLAVGAAAPVTRTVYVKADTSGHSALTHAAMQALARSPAQSAGRLRTARSILWQAGPGLHWQEALAGSALIDVCPAMGAAPSQRVGRQLAALHASALPMLPTVSTAALLRRMHQACAVLGQVEPAWQATLERLARGLQAGAGALGSLAPATLHGDLHPGNILLDGSQYSFIDLDNLRRGPAVLELGAWVADALCRAALDRTAQSGAPAWRAFLAGYAGAAHQRAPAPALLAWSTAYHLLCQRAYRCMARLKPGRYQLVPQLLAQADAILRAGSLDGLAPDGAARAQRQSAEAL